MRKIISLAVCFIMVMSMANVFAIDNLDDTAQYLIEAVDNPTVASVGGEWLIIGLARSGTEVPQEYFEKYYSNVLDYIRLKDGVLHSRKYTEYSRVILALTAIGKNPEDVAGYNLITPILDFDKTIWQGINGAIWALIALDCGDYGNAEIRDRYIEHILDKQKTDGGWALSDNQEDADADITAMALIALSKYKDRQDVLDAVNRGIDVLSKTQNENGGYIAYNAEASESTAQVLTALSALEISYDDARFIKNGRTLVDNLLSFKQSDGSFSHTDEPNLMATEQAFYALVAAKRFEEGRLALFDMSNSAENDEQTTVMEWSSSFLKELIDRLRNMQL